MAIALTVEQVKERIQELKRERHAVLLAHNYQVPDVQDVADFIGDSLALSRKAAATDAEEIVFCGVHFMAETASILCPDKRILIPDLGAGCSLASTIVAEDVRAWKEEHPDGVVVAYVNTDAAVKAEADYCCTSTNAVKVVQAIPPGKEVFFVPDMFLGAYVQKVTGRKLHIWQGECHVHAGIRPEDIRRKMAEHPDAEFLIHPECGCVSNCMYLLADGEMDAERAHIVSTEGMVKRVRESPRDKFIVATETGILYRLKKENPGKTLIPANPDAVCKYMKMITLEKVLRSLEDGVYEVKVPREIAERARVAIDRMVAIG
ncbi:MAG TPA: quinolinate synthase NadA [Thermoplasmata archaeon]|nr:quinolinate synthase NadA [Thermoplasmata archaeon]